MVYDAQTEQRAREQACQIAVEIVSRGNLLSYLGQQLRREAFDKIAASAPDDVATREAAYHMIRAADSIVGHIQNLAGEARRMRTKE